MSNKEQLAQIEGNFNKRMEDFQNQWAKEKCLSNWGQFNWGIEMELSGKRFNKTLPGLVHGDCTLSNGVYPDPVETKRFNLSKETSESIHGEYFEWSSPPKRREGRLDILRNWSREYGFLECFGNFTGGTHITFQARCMEFTFLGLALEKVMKDIYPDEVYKQRTASNYGHPLGNGLRQEVRLPQNGTKGSLGWECTQFACWGATADWVELFYLITISERMLANSYKIRENQKIEKEKKIISFMDVIVTSEIKMFIRGYKDYCKKKNDFYDEEIKTRNMLQEPAIEERVAV